MNGRLHNGDLRFLLLLGPRRRVNYLLLLLRRLLASSLCGFLDVRRVSPLDVLLELAGAVELAATRPVRTPVGLFLLLSEVTLVGALRHIGLVLSVVDPLEEHLSLIFLSLLLLFFTCCVLVVYLILVFVAG